MPLTQTAAPTAAAPLSIGDQVRLKPSLADGSKYQGVVFTVERLPKRRNEVNAVVRDAHGQGLKVRPSLLERVDAKPGDILPAITPIVHPDEIPTSGAVVKAVAGQGWREPAGSLWVVLSQGSRLNCVKVARLGGDGNRYYANIPLQFVEVVPLAELPAALAAAAL